MKISENGTTTSRNVQHKTNMTTDHNPTVASTSVPTKRRNYQHQKHTQEVSSIAVPTTGILIPSMSVSAHRELMGSHPLSSVKHLNKISS